MRSLVIYDSNFGNTKTVALAIATELKAEALSVNGLTPASLKGVDLLIVGSPINAWRPTTKVSMFLEAIPGGELRNMKAAAFDTRIKTFLSGNAAKRISKKLETKGASIVATPMAFYVKDKEGPLLEGVLEIARNWARQILQK
jgi:flavodoxin